MEQLGDTVLRALAGFGLFCLGCLIIGGLIEWLSRRR